MSSKEDLLRILNYSKIVLFGPKVSLFLMNQLTYYSNPNLGGRRYFDFEIPKRLGGHRKIYCPVEGLKAIQRCLNLVLSCVYKPQQSAHGFTSGRSIKTNAIVHAGSYYVFNVDLKDFFPSIDQARVWKVLQLEPFNLKSNDGGLTKRQQFEIASIISGICCTNMLVDRIDDKGNLVNGLRNVLPQGAPTSPLLSNVICQRLDLLLNGIAKRFGLKYTRYADDITFSSLHNVFQSHSPFSRELRRVITEQGFRINEEKVRLQRSAYRQMVTGLIVNERVNVPKKFIVSLRKSLYLWETYGIEKTALAYHKDNKLIDIPIDQVDMRQIIRGKISYLKDILGEDNNRYIHYKTRLENLISPVEKKAVVEKIDAKSFANKLEKLHELLRNNAIPSENASIKELKEFVSLINFQTGFLSMSTENIVEVEENHIHDPRFVVSILEKFTEETHLKYCTHFWDSDERYSNYQIFKGFILDDVRRYSFRLLPRYNSDLYWKIIYPFIIQDHDNSKKSGKKFEYGWGRHKLKVGYHYPGLVEDWMEKNPGQSPFEMPIPKEFQPLDKIEGKSLVYFEDFVDVFKSAIEFRGNDLYYLFREMTDNMLFDFNVNFNNIKGLSFYTHTHQIEKALKIIFNAIRKYTDVPNIEINGVYDSKEGFVEIEIIHLDSFCDKPIDDLKINLEDRRGDFYTIKKLLNSLCNWSIESRFRVGKDYKYYKINYLNDESIQRIVEIDEALGFTHRLRFYL